MNVIENHPYSALDDWELLSDVLFSKVGESPSEDRCGVFVRGRLEELGTSIPVDSLQLFSSTKEIIILLDVQIHDFSYLHWHLILHIFMNMMI